MSTLTRAVFPFQLAGLVALAVVADLTLWEAIIVSVYSIFVTVLLEVAVGVQGFIWHPANRAQMSGRRVPGGVLRG
jgi:ABC-type proline/glycine betaine transport system permease subunit